jgi:hypothetical protein
MWACASTGVDLKVIYFLCKMCVVKMQFKFGNMISKCGRMEVWKYENVFL